MNTAAKLQSWQGQVVDARFPLLQWLGGSALSDVFLTELPGGGSQKAAIKLIPAEAGTAALILSRWEAIAKLFHPHLIRLFAMGRCEINSVPLLYVVMEYAEEDLSQVLPSRPLTREEASQMLAALVDVLSFLHEKGFVHSHIKPSNIMAVGERLKISSDCLQASGKHGDPLAGAGLYDAPEIATGVMAPATDVWSVGMTLVAALSQHLPAWDNSEQKEPPVPDSILEPFREIARGCLHLDPKQRCTLKQVEFLLQATSTPQATGLTGIKRRTGLLIAAQLVLIALLAALWLVTHRRPVPLPQEAAKKEQPAPSAVPPPMSPVANTTTGVVKGEVIDHVLPNVPAGPRRTIQGEVKVSLRLVVDSSGAVSSATLESPGPSKYFANLALAAARRWKFKPAQVDGKPVSSKWTLRFRFGRTATEVEPVETSP
jgi:TonB family protein